MLERKRYMQNSQRMFGFLSGRQIIQDCPVGREKGGWVSVGLVRKGFEPKSVDLVQLKDLWAGKQAKSDLLY